MVDGVAAKRHHRDTSRDYQRRSISAGSSISLSGIKAICAARVQELGQGRLGQLRHLCVGRDNPRARVNLVSRWSHAFPDEQLLGRGLN